MNSGREREDIRTTGVRPAPEESAVAIADVLKTEEESRATIFFRVVAGLALLVAAFIPFLPGTLTLRVLAGVVCGTATIMCLFALTMIRRGHWTPAFATSVGISAGVLGVAAMLYIGLFSAGVMVLCLGIVFFGTSHHRVAARATYATIAVLYLVASVLIAFDFVEDVSLFSIAQVPRASRLYQVLMSQAVFAVTFYFARSSRRATENAVAEVNRHAVQLQRRDALLSEARRDLDRALRPGEGRHTGEVVGPYRLGDVLGRGGMGEVYRAEHVETRAAAAVKLLLPTLVDDPEHVQRFVREARAAAAVRTEGVVQVLEAGMTPGGAPFIVMELLDGHDLGWHLRHAGRLSLDTVVELLDEVSRALAAVRDAGIVHRDLKPANLFLTSATPGKWKVLDFGLSKILGGQTLTQDKAVGTPSYMAPEQVRGAKVDHLADLYALASLAYRALTGVPPFAGDDIAQILFRVLDNQPESPAVFAKLPIDVELVLAIGLAKEPGDRFTFVEEFASAMRLAAAGELDDPTRAKGWALLKKWPWGSTRVRKSAAAPRAKVA